MYKAAFACETPIRWDEDTWTLWASEVEMRKVIDEIIETAKENTKIDYALVVLSPSENFRKTIDPEYKANRNDKRKPVGLKACSNYLIEYYNAKIAEDDIEADDLIGIYAYANPDTAVICAADKDFKTVPCSIYDPETNSIDVIDEETADHNLRIQTLTGDSADNYKGASGVGPVKAQKWLEKHGSSWQSVLALFEQSGLTEEDCTRNARLARILRTADEKLTWRPDYNA